MLQTSFMHALSVLLLVISCRVHSTNINEPLVDVQQSTVMDLSVYGPRVAVINRTMETSVNMRRPQSNQILRLNAINHAISTTTTITTAVDDDDDNVQKMSNNQWLTSLASNDTIKSNTKSIASAASNGGKVYNKNDLRKRKVKSTGIYPYADWKCPNISENSRYLECGCDMPQTLRCSGDIHGLQQIADGLRNTRYPVSLLDCTLKNVTFLSDARIFDGVSLHGLVISSGEIKRVHRHAFSGMKTPLLELGLPNNALSAVPAQSLTALIALERLVLSQNRIKYLDASDFFMLQNLSYLELDDNNISGISQRAFLTLKNLQTLKLSGNRLEFGDNLQAIGQCINLKELDLSSNLLRGPLTRNLLPVLKSLESLNLGTNLLTSIYTGAFENFPFLTRLTLRHNQIDVLQDHSFSGLNALQMLDLSHNGIVAISGSSLKHLSRLLVLNLTHNFLRALTADLVMPLPSLKELHVDGNDISMVAKNAFIGANALETLTLRDNPLSCDCSLKPFAEWMSKSSISAQDQLSAVCATPPHLEGATLQEIPLDSLNCDGNVNRNSNANVLHQLEIRAKQSNLTFVNKFSDDIILKKIHLSMDYGLIITWSVTLNSADFSCDAILVYKESKWNESLMENLPMHCESNKMENENIVSVILYDATQFVIGDKYRFCLVLVQKNNDQRELVVGCSNITKLKQIENVLVTDRNVDHFTVPVTMKASSSSSSSSTPPPQPLPTAAATTKLEMGTMQTKLNQNNDEEMISDISSFEKISDQKQTERQQFQQIEYTTIHQSEMPTTVKTIKAPIETAYASQLMNHFNDGLMPSLSIGVLITSVFAFIWAATKITHHRRSIPSTVCYAAADQHSVDIEHSNRYLKLQATTTL